MNFNAATLERWFTDLAQLEPAPLPFSLGSDHGASYTSTLEAEPSSGQAYTGPSEEQVALPSPSEDGTYCCPIPDCSESFTVLSTDSFQCELGDHLRDRHSVNWYMKPKRGTADRLCEFVCFWPGCLCKKRRATCSDYGNIHREHPAHVKSDPWKHVKGHIFSLVKCECGKPSPSMQYLKDHRRRAWADYWKKHPDDKAKVQQCKGCSKSFICADALLGHCQECPLMTSQGSS
jgi:hypothetical protein